MGTGFRLNPKWGFQVHSHPLSNSPLRLSPSPVKGREAAFNSVRLSLPSIIFEEDGIILKDPFKGRAFSSAAPQITESDYLQTEELKVNVGNSFYKGSCKMVEDAQRPVGEEKSTTLRSPQPCSRSYFSFLMENLDALEETFADSNVLRLEKAILLQLGRLGALKLFNTRLSRTLESSNVFDLSDVPTENIGGHMVDGPASDCLGKRFVRSSKKAKRKSRRERASANANKISSLPLPSKNKGKSFRKPSVSTVNKAFNNRSKRLIISRNEGEMSKGVKMLANLERIRTILEEESGKVASLSCWAEAAGVNEKMLLQYLHFGWRCRDELLRSTRSLVLYLARTYRGLGVAYEDLLQAGNLGVLQGAERFDHTRGYRFSTYAQYWIRKSMSRMVSRHARGIRIPCTMSRTINQIQKARKSLNNSHRKYPEDDEITKLTGLSLNKIRSASKCLRVVGSIDQKIGDSLNAKYLEFMPDTTIKSSEKIVMRQHLKKDLYDLLIGLDMREKEVMVLRYGLKDCRPKSLEEIGSLFKVSKEWIRKIEKKAMTKLRDKETCKNLSFYLDL